jgi:PAT family beta-lactamase induction signal transducer AmpG
MSSPAVERPAAARPSTLSSLGLALRSWRLGAITLLSFSSGLPLGLVLSTVPFWMDQAGIDIKTIGLLTATQAPYAFKFLWSPLMDRFAPQWSRRRFWILVGQGALALTTAALALSAGAPTVAAVAVLTLLISFASATQDIAVDAYAVEALRPEEQGLAVGARTALYRAAMYVSGAVLITLGPSVGWPACFAGLSVLYVAMTAVTFFSPEPEVPVRPPPSLRAAVWEPFVGFFRHSRALEIIAFLFLYKLGDNLAGALVGPFLNQRGYDALDVGVARGTIGLIATLAGTFLGGLLTNPLGVGRALWIFGVLQAVSNLGYAAVAEFPPSRPLMYLAIAVEAGTTGMGNGAFGVLLLRLTQRKFSATQFALFSSVFALGRTVAGPPAGALVDALGWRDFFLLTIAFAAPGLAMLQRFVPVRERDIPAAPPEDEAPAAVGSPVTPGGLVWRGAVGALLGTGLAYAASAVLLALKGMRGGKAPFDLGAAFDALAHPARAVDSVDLIGGPVFGVVLGFAVAAYVAARRGVARPARSG